MTKEKKAELLRVIKYTLFAASAGLVQFGSFTLLTEVTPLPYWPCYLISLVLSVVWNFTFNRKFTFKSAANVPIAMLKVLGYYVVFTPLSTYLGHLLVENAHWNEYLVEVLSMLVNFVTEFLFQRFLVFGKTIDTNAAAKKAAEDAATTPSAEPQENAEPVANDGENEE
ncbi:MAG: GtrA family protein [Clostridia bacterium]|nr:GtrA family protein [Clostridia bacterium]